jgi:hypothetical protein
MKRIVIFALVGIALLGALALLVVLASTESPNPAIPPVAVPDAPAPPGPGSTAHLHLPGPSKSEVPLPAAVVPPFAGDGESSVGQPPPQPEAPPSSDAATPESAEGARDRRLKRSAVAPAGDPDERPATSPANDRIRKKKQERGPRTDDG